MPNKIRSCTLNRAGFEIAWNKTEWPKEQMDRLEEILRKRYPESTRNDNLPALIMRSRNPSTRLYMDEVGLSLNISETPDVDDAISTMEQVWIDIRELVPSSKHLKWSSISGTCKIGFENPVVPRDVLKLNLKDAAAVLSGQIHVGFMLSSSEGDLMRMLFVTGIDEDGTKDLLIQISVRDNAGKNTDQIASHFADLYEATHRYLSTEFDRRR